MLRVVIFGRTRCRTDCSFNYFLPYNISQWRSLLQYLAEACTGSWVWLSGGSGSPRPGLPNIAGRTALAVRPDVVNVKYHVITNATYNRDPVPAKVKHVTNIETCTLLCCDNEIIARCGKLCMQTRWKSVLAALTKTSKFY